MNAILLAAGYGKRLKSITKKIPKCLIKINGKALLGIWIERLNVLGVKNILINTHYLSEKVEKFVKNSAYSNKIKTVHEKKLLGTGKTVLKNLNLLNDEDTLIIHADNFCLDNLKKLILKHNKRPKKCSMTMMIFKCKEPKLYGIVELDKVGIVKKMHEKVKNPPGSIANCAIYVVSNKFFTELKKIKKVKDFSKDILPNFLGKIYTYQTKKPFFDIGTSKYLKEANRVFQK